MTGPLDHLPTAVATSRLTVAGLDSHEIAREVLAGTRLRLRRGVLSAGPVSGQPFAHADARAAGALLVADAAAVSHIAAGRVHGLTALPRHDVVCITRVRRTGSRRRATIERVHVHQARLDDDEVRSVRGIPVTSPARTVADLARVLRAPAALAMVDAALRTGSVTREDVGAVLERQRGWAGVRSALRVLAAADGAAESALESEVRAALVIPATGCTPQLQYPVRGASGRCYRVDLCWPDRRTIVEVDGRVKYDQPWSGSGSDALWAEKRREDDLREAGWEVVRIVAADLHDDAGAIRERVRAAAARGARRHGRPHGKE